MSILDLFAWGRRRSVYLAVMDALCHEFSDMPFGSRVGEEPLTPEQVLPWQEKVDCLRAWSCSVDDSLTRSTYVSWLNYYQRQINRSASKKQYLWWKRLAERGKNRSIKDANLRASITIPTPRRSGQ